MVGDCDAAQAVELIRALRHQLHVMAAQVARLERLESSGRNGKAGTLRAEASALRRDMHEAQVLIDRLRHRYLSGRTAG